MAMQQHDPDEPASARRWAEALAAWAIPAPILDAAPDTPYGFDVGTFSRIADEALERPTPSQRVAREAVPDGGSVLDVGCGGGAAGLPLAPPAALLVGVDEGAGMLAAFAHRAEARGVAHTEIEGRWPDVADQAPAVDVVVCHNVLYNVADIALFVRALADHARSRVVVEITEEHPLAWTNPYWKHFHGIDRPRRPTADDAAAVVRDLGFSVQQDRWDRPWGSRHTPEEMVAQMRQRLCLAPEHDNEIQDLLERVPPPTERTTVTLWWPPATT